MNITVVCEHCRHHDIDPNIEINIKDGMIYYLCPKCKKESKVKLKVENKPYPKIRTR